MTRRGRFRARTIRFHGGLIAGQRAMLHDFLKRGTQMICQADCTCSRAHAGAGVALVGAGHAETPAAHAHLMPCSEQRRADVSCAPMTPPGRAISSNARHHHFPRQRRRLFILPSCFSLFCRLLYQHRPQAGAPFRYRHDDDAHRLSPHAPTSWLVASSQDFRFMTLRHRAFSLYFLFSVVSSIARRAIAVIFAFTRCCAAEGEATPSRGLARVLAEMPPSRQRCLRAHRLRARLRY